MKRAIITTFRIAISIGLIGILLYIMRDSLPGMMEALKRVPLHIFILGALLFIAAIAIASMRLHILLRLQDINMSVDDVFRVNFIGYFFSSFLPTAVGGDVVKAIYISRQSKKTMQAYTSVFIDRFLGMVTIFIIAMIAILLVKDTSGMHLAWFLPLLLTVSAAFIAVLVNKKLAKKFSFIFDLIVPIRFKDKMKNLYNAIHKYKDHRGEIGNCVLLSFLGQITSFLAAYFLVEGIGSHASLKVILLVMPVASMVSMLPSINGIGPREMSMVIMLKPFIGKGPAAAVAFLWLGLLLLTSLIGGIVYMFMGHYRINITDLAELNSGKKEV